MYVRLCVLMELLFAYIILTHVLFAKKFYVDETENISPANEYLAGKRNSYDIFHI